MFLGVFLIYVFVIVGIFIFFGVIFLSKQFATFCPFF